MAPTESDILHNYLTVPAQLPSIISLDEFTELFPKAHRSNPQIRLLYRDLQHQRRGLVDTVAENIADEEKRGKSIKREIAYTRRKAAQQEADPELEIERAVCPPAMPHGEKIKSPDIVGSSLAPLRLQTPSIPSSPSSLKWTRR